MKRLNVRGTVVSQITGTIQMFKKIWEWILITPENGQDAEISIKTGITQKVEMELNPFGIIKNFILNIVC
jgi:hypothetical protein